MKLKIKEFLTRNAITQGEFAELVGCGQNTVSFWIHGKTKPQKKYLRKISKIYNIPIAEVVAMFTEEI